MPKMDPTLKLPLPPAFGSHSRRFPSRKRRWAHPSLRGLEAVSGPNELDYLDVRLTFGYFMMLAEEA